MRWRSQNFDTIRGLVARNLGYSYLNWKPLVVTTDTDARVTYVPLSDPIASNPIIAALPLESAPSRKVDEAIHCIREVLAV